jgi:hypothetical protein
VPLKAKALAEFKKAIKVDGDLKKVPLDHRVPDIFVCLSTETGSEEQAELLDFLDKNTNVFT